MYVKGLRNAEQSRESVRRRQCAWDSLSALHGFVTDCSAVLHCARRQLRVSRRLHDEDRLCHDQRSEPAMGELVQGSSREGQQRTDRSPDLSSKPARAGPASDRRHSARHDRSRAAAGRLLRRARSALWRVQHSRPVQGYEECGRGDRGSRAEQGNPCAWRKQRHGRHHRLCLFGGRLFRQGSHPTSRRLQGQEIPHQRDAGRTRAHEGAGRDRGPAADQRSRARPCNAARSTERRAPSPCS